MLWLATLLALVAPGPTTVHAEIEGAVDGIDGTFSAAISPDGAYMYVAGSREHAVAVFRRDESTGELEYQDVYFDGVGPIVGLRGPRSLAMSPDGAHLYIASFDSSALAVFSRNPGTGSLTFVEAQFDGIGGVNGLSRVTSVAVSPDGAHVYTAAGHRLATFPDPDHAVAVFSRNAGTGVLTFVEAEFDLPFPGTASLDGAESVALSPDGAHVYVAASGDDALNVFSRNAGTGHITFVESHIGGLGGVVDGLRTVGSVALSPDGAHVYATGGISNTISSELAVFSRDAVTGELTWVEAHPFPSPGLVRPRAVAVSMDGSHVYVANDYFVALFSRDVMTGVLTFVQNFDFGGFGGPFAGPDGSAELNSITSSPDGEYLYVTGHDEDAVYVLDRDAVSGALAFVESEIGRVEFLPPTKLRIKNRLPDDEEKNFGKWTAKTDLIRTRRNDSRGDPRCNDDPPGTVKATIRFVSDSSGQDTGALDLPCQNWRSAKPNGSLVYKDSRLNDSSCKLVLLKWGIRLQAKCFGKGATTDFPYDLTEGTAEGTVYAVLRTGIVKWCAAFGDFLPGKDGSDGKALIAKNSVGLGVCPVPLASPSGAFLDPTTGFFD